MLWVLYTYIKGKVVITAWVTIRKNEYMLEYFTSTEFTKGSEKKVRLIISWQERHLIIDFLMHGWEKNLS